MDLDWPRGADASSPRAGLTCVNAGADSCA